VYVNIQHEPSMWGSESEDRTLYQPYIYILPALRPSWANVHQNLVGKGREGESSLLEVADSELCTASHKSGSIILAILRLNLTAELTWHWRWL